MKKEGTKKSGKGRRQPNAAGVTKMHPKRPKKQLKAAEHVLPTEEPVTTATPIVTSEATSAPAPAGKAPRRHTTLLVVAAVLCVVVLLWVMGSLLLSTIRIGNTTVSGRLSSAALRQQVAIGAAQYRLRLTYPDGHSKAFSLQAIGVQPDPAGSVAAARREQQSLPHLLAWWRPVPVHLHTTVNAQALDNFIAQNTRMVTQPARNAELGIINGTAQINPGAVGKQYGLSNPSQTILTTATQLQTTPLQLRPRALQPSITVSALKSAKAKLEAILQQHIEIGVGDQTVTPLSRDIAQWLVLTPRAANVDITVDTRKLHDYLNGLATGHAQPARSQILLDTTGAVLVSGVRGTSIGDTQNAADTLAHSLLDGKGTQLALPVQYTAFKTVRAPTAGKWIEVDTTAKRLYAYDQGQLVHSFLISAGAAATPTVVGRFAIYSKYRSQDMFGGNVDGSRYFQPHVPYVNYFYRDYAIHGNYWRPSSYFGNVNSSHGCVGLPVSDGAWIYSWAPIGTPVIVHT